MRFAALVIFIFNELLSKNTVTVTEIYEEQERDYSRRTIQRAFKIIRETINIVEYEKKLSIVYYYIPKEFKKLNYSI